MIQAFRPTRPVVEFPIGRIAQIEGQRYHKMTPRWRPCQGLELVLELELQK